MAESQSKRITRRFGHGRRAQTFEIARSEVLPVLEDAGGHTDRLQWVRFHGTPAELVAAGVATPDMFDIGKSTQRTTFDGFADFTVHRRGKRRFDVTIVTWAHEHEELDDNRTRNLVWWKEHGAQVDAAVAEILQRLQRTKEVRS